MNVELFEQFKNRQLKAKDYVYIKKISKAESQVLVKQYHYLGHKGFMFSFSYGLFLKENDELIGCAVFGRPSFPQTIKGWLGYEDGAVCELHRLVMKSEYNGCNLTSYLLGNSLKIIKNDGYKMVISLADASLHIGYIYQACNFKYYGMTNSKTDFYCIDGSLNPKRATKKLQGVWLPRNRKHRYAYIFDKSLDIKYKELPFPKSNERIKTECCNGTKEVYDNRFGVWYTCPRCCGKLKVINKEE